MSDTNYTRWYREGSATLTQNSDIITGTNTYWLNANIKPGDMFTLDSSKFYEVENVDSNTQITLKTPYLGSTISGANYAVIRNFTATLPAETAAKVVTVLAKNEKYVDEPMNTLRGQSAYEVALENGFVGNESEWLDTLNAYGQAKKNGYIGSLANWLESLTAYGIAKDNGFTGSEADWLESLIGAGEWQKLAKRTTSLENIDPALSLGAYSASQWYRPGGAYYEKIKKVYFPSQEFLHNSIVRGKWLGNTFTEEQLQSIYNGTFEDMYLGDYWTITLGDVPALAEFAKTTDLKRSRITLSILEFNRHKHAKIGETFFPLLKKVGLAQNEFNYAQEKARWEGYRESYPNVAAPHDFDGKIHIPCEDWETAKLVNHITVMATCDFATSNVLISDENNNSLKNSVNEDLPNTGYAFSNLRKNMENSLMVKNAIKPFFGEENFLTWCELQFSRFDTATLTNTTPFLAHCKFEHPSFYELYGEKRHVDDIFRKTTGYSRIGGVGHLYGYDDLRKHAFFRIIPAVSVFYCLISRDICSANEWMSVGQQEPYFMTPYAYNRINPIFCIGVNQLKLLDN